MPHVSLRVTEEEKNCMDSYADFHGIKLSEAIKNAFFEKMEDEYDIKLFKEYKKEKPGRFYTMEEVKRELGLVNE